MNQGYIKISDYNSLLKSAKYKVMEKFSSTFLELNSEPLRPFSKKWVRNPLHQVSRRWEYPFVYHWLSEYVKSSPKISKINILDAGSGVTFFPFFIKKQFPMINMECVDYDSCFQKIYHSINENMNTKVNFNVSSIDNTRLDSQSFDIIYCISVLEHTKNYAHIIEEFHRLLKPGGQLILTFDISIDGRSDIPLPEARNLISLLEQKMKPTDPTALSYIMNEDISFQREIITTEYIRGKDASLLPWKYPRLSGAYASLKKGKFPIFKIKQLTFACLIFEKE